MALLCNAANVDAERVGSQVAELFLGPAVKPESAPTPATVAPAALEARVGLYRNTRTQGTLRLVMAEGALRIERGPRLVALSESTFQLADGPARFEFEAGGPGRRARLVSRPPSADPVTFEPVEEFAPTPAQLADYTGEYHSEEAEAAYTVAVQDGKLVLRARPDLALVLAPVYADVFTSQGDLVRFLRGGNGRVEGLSLFLGRVRDLRFTRRSTS